MLELEFSKVTATLEALNCRVERAGPDKIPAADLKVSLPTDADVLAHFAPTLRDFLFAPGPKDLLGDTVMAVRDPHMGYPLSRDEEMTGATVQIGYGVGDPIHLPDCTLNQFRLTPQDGGSVIVAFRIQCRPSPEQIARLYTLQETGIELTLEPMDVPEMKAA